MKKLFFAIYLLVCVSCSHFSSRGVSYLQHSDWAPDVRDGLNAFMDDCAGKTDAYVVFDFDNTTSIFDIMDNLSVYMLETMSFNLTPKQLDEVLSTGLEGHGTEYLDWVADITSAYTKLYSDYGPFTAAGLPEGILASLKKDPQWKEFATKMLAMYDNVGEWTSTDDSYKWILYWFTGMTEKEVYDLSYASHKKYSAVNTFEETWTSPSSIESKVGPVSIDRILGVQVSENLRELWKCLSKNGIDVWVCSASASEVVKAAVDCFNLHNYCKGVLAMTICKDERGLCTNAYDYVTGYQELPTKDGWAKGTLATKSLTAGPGKVTSILNSIAPLYHGATPLAGFMDSTGDFNFCTEFSSLRTVVCFNRADRKTTDGGGLIAEVAIYEKETLEYDYAAARKAGDTLYLLQGRDENGLRSLRPSNKTLRFGQSVERLFAGEGNQTELDSMILGHKSVADAINDNAHHFLHSYNGYHNK